MTPDADALLAALADPRKSVQRPAADTLAAMLPRAPSLRARVAALLQAPDFRLRFVAAYTLARAEGGSADALPILLEALGVEDGDVRWAAARIVVATLGDRLADVLGPLLSDAEPRRRKMVLYCLRETGRAEPRLAPQIAARLADDDVGVRLAALATAAVLLPASHETAAMILASLAAPAAGVRRAAAAALGALGVADQAVVEALTNAAAGDDPALARAASSALTRLAAGAARR